MFDPSRGLWDNGRNMVPTQLAKGEVWASNGTALLTAGIFTITPTNCTPVFDYIGGRACVSMTGAGAATDGAQWQVPAGIYQFQTGKTAIYKAGIRMTGVTGSWRLGWAAIDTSIIASDPTDIAMLEKLTGATAFRSYTRKASATAVAGNTMLPTVAADTWYDIEIAFTKLDTSVGQMTVALGAGLSPGQQLNYSTTYLINGSFPDTVDLSPSLAFLAGTGNATGYWAYQGWAVEG